MMNESNTPTLDLHDATLSAVLFDWREGTLEIRVQADESPESLKVHRASDVRSVSCSRDLPWGLSDAINTVRLTNLEFDSRQRLEIEMQSGDLLIFDAQSFAWRKEAS